ncbi:MAG: twin-arginine translocase TatA/TatE family subunit [Pseudomonadota bacterium]|nr:twin-arginine translocase TatA/TatE family subunit [Pseudomonadota bacterium]
MFGLSPWELLIILAIVILLFGGKRLKNLGGDLGSSIKGFKKAMKEDQQQDSSAEIPQKRNTTSGTVIESEQANVNASSSN